MGRMESAMTYPVKRDLDGIYFHVERDGKWCDVCLTDLTDEEYEKMTANREASWHKSALDHLRDVVREIGDATGIIRGN